MTPLPRHAHAAEPALDIQVQSPLWAGQPLSEQTVRAAIAAAAAMLSTKDGELGIVFADDSSVRALNRQWRGIDKPTNVLSFPAGTAANNGPAMFGDIVLAYETLCKECDEEGMNFQHHLAHLTIHGFLHLIGYDHGGDAEADEMEGLESKIMKAMNLPDPWLGCAPGREMGGA